MTIFVTWQLIVTLDSIRNSCDVSTWRSILIWNRPPFKIVTAHFLDVRVPTTSDNNWDANALSSQRAPCSTTTTLLLLLSNFYCNNYFYFYNYYYYYSYFYFYYCSNCYQCSLLDPPIGGSNSAQLRLSWALETIWPPIESISVIKHPLSVQFAWGLFLVDRLWWWNIFGPTWPMCPRIYC